MYNMVASLTNFNLRFRIQRGSLDPIDIHSSDNTPVWITPLIYSQLFVHNH
jgi:hypothetical protein